MFIPLSKLPLDCGEGWNDVVCGAISSRFLPLCSVVDGFVDCMRRYITCSGKEGLGMR